MWEAARKLGLLELLRRSLRNSTMSFYDVCVLTGFVCQVQNRVKMGQSEAFCHTLEALNVLVAHIPTAAIYEC
jgi:hypothetical protein